MRKDDLQDPMSGLWEQAEKTITPELVRAHVSDEWDKNKEARKIVKQGDMEELKWWYVKSEDLWAAFKVCPNEVDGALVVAETELGVRRAKGLNGILMPYDASNPPPKPLPWRTYNLY